MTDRVQALLQIWTELSKTYPKYVNKFRARHQNIIYTCVDGNIVSQERGNSLHKQDRSTDGPREESYLGSDLDPVNEQERKIIEDYNQLVKDKYQQALKADALQYQYSTLMIQYEKDTTVNDEDYEELYLDRYITRQFKKYDIYVSVEELMSRCVLIVFLDELKY